MLFNSLEFIFFFPLVVALYFALSPKYRWILLLIASYYFYMCWNYKYVVLIFTTTFINYIAGIQIYKSERRKVKKFYLIAGLVTSLGILFFFKYFNFFGESLNFLFNKFNIFYSVPSYDFLLPVGISFYTFQTLSYTIDVYRNNQEPEYHFGKFALFVSFFPQLVAGPIERSINLLPQFHKKFYLDYERMKNGIILMAYGFFKKVVIADRLSEYVSTVYNNPEIYSGINNIIATFFFSFQIYCDFSGYSDIAIGTALIMGYKLMQNFNRPYFAINIREFWQRWHISLSTWFRDYVYIPLGGSRVNTFRRYFNLFVTFLVSGLWHGANWTFVIWGALHGLYSVIGVRFKFIQVQTKKFFQSRNLNVLHRILQILFTYLLVYFSWIFFRANNVTDAFLIIKKIFVFSDSNPLNLFHFKIDFYLSFILIAILIVFEIFSEWFQIRSYLGKLPGILKIVLVILLFASIFILGKWDSIDFLYFQF
ncbi:MAG: MBOAT family protein [Bacteroidales bacterium]|nr:MBOAT family protein [Bacteroidales bacterium]